MAKTNVPHVVRLGGSDRDTPVLFRADRVKERPTAQLVRQGTRGYAGAGDAEARRGTIDDRRNSLDGDMARPT